MIFSAWRKNLFKVFSCTQYYSGIISCVTINQMGAAASAKGTLEAWNQMIEFEWNSDECIGNYMLIPQTHRQQHNPLRFENRQLGGFVHSFTQLQPPSLIKSENSITTPPNLIKSDDFPKSRLLSISTVVHTRNSLQTKVSFT